MSVSTSGRGWTGRALRAVPFALQIGITAALGMSSVGCGALAALTNPKAGWALTEPAPMGVVVRRAEVANATARQVDRLMGRTPVDDTSKWIPKTALKKADAEALLQGMTGDDTYAAAQGAKLRVVPAEAWVATFSEICSDESKYPSLLAATSPALASAYDEISSQQKELTTLKADRAAEEKALDAKDLTDASKKEHEKKKEEIETAITKQEDSFKPKVEAFLAKIKEEAPKVDDATKRRLGVALVNLRRAVDDAKTDNSVALIRYPLAVPSLTQDIQSSAKRILADVIEEKTGTRPDLSSLKPEVTLDGMTPKLTIAGLSPSDIGGLNPGDVISETTTRLGNYTVRVMTLIAFADGTQTQLSFEADVLDAWIDGFKLDASKLEGAGDELGDLKIETGTVKAKSTKDAKDPKLAQREHSAGGVRAAACGIGEKAKPTQAEATNDTSDKVADKGKGKGQKPKAGAAAKPTSSKPAQDGPTKTAVQTTPQKPASGPTQSVSQTSEKPAPNMSTGQKCDLVVTNGQGTTCL